MLRAASFVLSVGLALAIATSGVAARPKPSPPAASQAEGLRGPQSLSAPARPLQSPIPRAAPSAFPSGFAAGSAGGDSCRLACSHRYYFCLTGDSPEQCPGQWIECRASCGSGERSSVNQP
ncbi:hypothetical protein [Phenylobacterium montanum]|uniref:Chitin-binding type-2 domain-containing protein n=1 Tax=Phenylobacterium montanum TaxID=2823693 RepID=A0A975FYU4_9CAUL|nr:hypothetical protein [Caulobacter sp. S6]QUD87357.1 hypothetical protein KCG34_20245 [Caulobacter sp. S6]